jgi:hypothetical protein
MGQIMRELSCLHCSCLPRFLQGVGDEQESV